MKNRDPFVYLFLGLLLNLFWTASVTASEYRPAGSTNGLKVMANRNTDADYIALNKANSSGISVNTFAEFMVSDRPLRLIQGGIQDSNYRPAKLIVIKADTIVLANTVELTGDTANILFVSSASSTATNIQCQACRLENFGRITLAAANSQYAINLNTMQLGNLSTVSSGKISINNMDTAGAYSLEVISEQVSTAGLINTHIRGSIDSNGGYTVSTEGKSIVAVAGINLYLGTNSLGYESLERVTPGTSSVYTSEQVLDGTLKAGMINIVSSSPLTLKSTSSLSTASDLISSTMHNGEFNTLLEGVYIQTTRASGGRVRLNGSITSDNLIQVLAQNDLEINNSLITHKADLFSDGAIKLLPSAKLMADYGVIGAEWFSNRGEIAVSSLSIESTKTLYNHFGGKISGNDIQLVSLEGTVINGSRTNKYYVPANLPSLSLDSEFTPDDKYGVYRLVNGETGQVVQNLSASITGNEISIKGERFENINPYHLVKPESETWANGVRLDSNQSRRVAVQAELALDIEATEYAVNSSAVIGLNQAGWFDINTPLLMNQRYRTEAILAVYSRVSYDRSGGVPTASRSNVDEIETYLTAYSPPGVLYTFGNLSFSDGVEDGGEIADFINQFSFVEVLSNAHFHEAQFHSLGLAMAARRTAGFEPVRCATHGCAASNYVSLIESETLTAFGGDVYGLSSDLVVQTVNQLEDASKMAFITAFVDKRREEVAYEETFVNPTGVSGDITTYQYLSKWEVTNRGNNEVLLITVTRCNKIEYYYDNVSNTCLQSQSSYALSNILTAEAGDNLLNGLPWTSNEVREKASEYVSALSYDGSLKMPAGNSIPGTYVAEYVIYKITDDSLYIIIDYRETFAADNVGSLEEAESRTAGYYNKSKTTTVRLHDLMGSITPPAPSGLRASYTLSSNQATINLNWNAIAGSFIEYRISNSETSSNTTHNIINRVSTGNNSFSYRVQACNSVACSDWSTPVTVSIQVAPSAIELGSCRASFYRPFSNKYRRSHDGITGNYCAVTEKNGKTYYVVAEQRQQTYPDGRTIYGRCEMVRYFERDKLVSAILDGTTLPQSSFTERSNAYESCDEMLSFSLSELK